MIAESLDLPVDKVRVIMTACGGAFGGKEEPAGQIHAAIAALRTGRPAKVVLSREESIRISTKRHPMHVWMRHAAAKDGRLLAVSSRAIADAAPTYP
jgi:CO/xanthine dehydrogenase Mo-binding subunit